MKNITANVGGEFPFNEPSRGFFLCCLRAISGLYLWATIFSRCAS